ncbi:MAG: hypothetical protein GWO16_05550 [Gammaproteobacteria bacterium]|nr:hypothetical protein [Gammaproteobacteria bacterium]
MHIVVPAEEQSWRGKAVTRFGRIRAETRPEFGVPAFAVTGTPSDCVNLAIHHLLPEPPALVISGINIGSNAGSGFVVNSGTVGAAIEAWLQGVPTAAFSTYLHPELFREWNTERRLTQPDALTVVETTTARTADMVRTLLAPDAVPLDGVLNVNFPGAVTPDMPVRWVPLQRSRYGSLFRRDGDGFVHSAQIGLSGDDRADTDRAVIMAGAISATLLSLDNWSRDLPKAQRPPL